MPSNTYSLAGVYSFTIPAAVTAVTIECWGAGGGGCSYPINGGGSGGGGGGGSYVIANGVPVTPGQVLTITVGAGGAAGSGDGGAAGGDSFVYRSGDPGGSTAADAIGGSGAYRNTGGSGGGGFGFFGNAGGAGANGNSGGFTPPGGYFGAPGGGAATSTSPGTAGDPGTGIPGSFGGGNGGDRGGSGGNGSAPGGGGGGAGVTQFGGGTGGNGGDGQVVITYTLNTTQRTLPMAGTIKTTAQRTLPMAGTITSTPQSGYNVIRFNVAPAIGHDIYVSYYRLGADIIAVENTALVAARAAAEQGTGKYQQLAQDTSDINSSAGLLSAQQGLQLYGVLPIQIQIQTYRPGLLPGQLLTIAFPTGPAWNAPAFLNGAWLIQQVDAQYTPGLPDSWGSPPLIWDAATMTWINAGFTWASGQAFGNIVYTITAVNVPHIPNYVDFWKQVLVGKK